MKYLVVLALGAGCGLNDDIAGKVTIDHGVYGLLSSGGVGAANQRVSVYAAISSGAYATSRSDDQGVYQITLPVGDYTICTSGCITISTSDSTIRYDWTDGPGGGTWNKN